MGLEDGREHRLCGGVLVGARQVLTAGHCLRGLSDSGTEVLGDGWRSGVKASVPYEGFEMSTPRGLLGDLAIVELDSDAPVIPVRIADSTAGTVRGEIRAWPSMAATELERGAVVIPAPQVDCGGSPPDRFGRNDRLCGDLVDSDFLLQEGVSGSPIFVGEAVVGVVSKGSSGGTVVVADVVSRRRWVDERIEQSP